MENGENEEEECMMKMFVSECGACIFPQSLNLLRSVCCERNNSWGAENK